MYDPRILIASALGRIIQPVLIDAIPDGRVVIATNPDELSQALNTSLAFDIALVDLCWHDRRLEWNFDGLDAIRAIHIRNASTACICTMQGESFEDDHAAEALDQSFHPEILGVIEKAHPPTTFGQVIQAAAFGNPWPVPRVVRSPGSTAIHEYFSRGRGRTAGRLAATIATGRVSRYEQLARLANVAPDTASKVTSYLEPLLRARNEIDLSEPVTQSAVYRWCGEHAPYLMSWARRNLPPDTGITRRERSTLLTIVER